VESPEAQAPSVPRIPGADGGCLLASVERVREAPARFCDACQMHVSQGPDTCLGYLPGVSHACCGHGDVDSAYVVLGGEPNQKALTIANKLTPRGERALQFFALVRSGREHPSLIDL